MRVRGGVVSVSVCADIDNLPSPPLPSPGPPQSEPTSDGFLSLFFSSSPLTSFHFTVVEFIAVCVEYQLNDIYSIVWRFRVTLS